MPIYNDPDLIWRTLFLVLFTGVVSIIAFNDVRTKEIPNVMVAALIPLSIMSVWLYPEISGISRLVGLFTASAPMLIMTLIWPKVFGGGDIKLMAVVGLILGWQLTLLAFIIASFLGICHTIIMLILRKTTLKDTMAFGPALCIGTLTAFIAGDTIMRGLFSLL